MPAGQLTDLERNLLDASRRGDTQSVRALLESEVDVEVADKDGSTSLMLAARHGHVATMRVLVEAGAPIDAPGRATRTGWPALMSALHADQAGAAVSLLEWGADPNAHEDSGYSALMMAASRGSRVVVEELLARGADPRAELFLGFTALDYAIGYGHAEIVRMLLEAAPELKRRRNGARRAVLTLATRAGDQELLDLLA
jgi:ankyrin repeat protein